MIGDYDGFEYEETSANDLMDSQHRGMNLYIGWSIPRTIDPNYDSNHCLGVGY